MPANRYAVSLLPRQFGSEAFPEELMMDSNTGQIVYKTTDGKIISDPAMVRTKAHTESLRSIVSTTDELNNINMYKAIVSDAPIQVTTNTNLVTTPCRLTLNNNGFLALSIDASMLYTTSRELIPVTSVGNAVVRLNFINGGTTTPVDITMNGANGTLTAIVNLKAQATFTIVEVVDVRIVCTDGAVNKLIFHELLMASNGTILAGNIVRLEVFNPSTALKTRTNNSAAMLSNIQNILDLNNLAPFGSDSNAKSSTVISFIGSNPTSNTITGTNINRIDGGVVL